MGRRYRRHKNKYNYNSGYTLTFPKFLLIVAVLAAAGVFISVKCTHNVRHRDIEAAVADTVMTETAEASKLVEAIAEPAADDSTAVDTTSVSKEVKKEKNHKQAKEPKQAKESKRAKKSRQAEPEVKAAPALLNMILTNEMSDVPELRKMDREIERFMRYWNFTGATVAITDKGRLVYCKGYGFKDDFLPMTPGTIMRIASVSKLITATAVMRLIEDGKLSMSSKVFGEEGILNDTTYTNVIRDKRYFDITVEHLLKHESGISNRWGDPMFSTRDIIAQNNLDGAPDHETLVRCVVRRPVPFEPGTTYRYSNFGYLLLSMIIEKVTGESYEQWVNANILEKAGCRDMHIARNMYEERRINESRYYMQPNAGLVAPFNGAQDSVISCYGGSDIRALAGAGGWVASAPELARFVSAIDGLDSVPDIISENSRQAMSQPDELSEKPFGWANIDKNGTLTRSGTLDGSNIMVKYYPDGQCWIFISNTDAWRGPLQSKTNSAELDRLREKYADFLPDINLFELGER